jgi:hypothetical protein
VEVLVVCKFNTLLVYEFKHFLNLTNNYLQRKGEINTQKNW